MQIKSLGTYRSLRVNDIPTTPKATKRLQQIETYHTLREEGCSQTVALKVIGCSRATYYRWLTKRQKPGCGT